MAEFSVCVSLDGPDLCGLAGVDGVSLAGQVCVNFDGGQAHVDRSDRISFAQHPARKAGHQAPAHAAPGAWVVVEVARFQVAGSQVVRKQGQVIGLPGQGAG